MQTLSPEVEQLVQQAMMLGGNASANDVLRDALLSWIDRQESLAAIQRGLDDITAGRTVPFEQFDREFRIRHGIGDDA